MQDPPERNQDRDVETAALVREEGAPPRSFAPGLVAAGRYRIDAYLAEGGMGQVFRAHDLELDVPLALKTIRPEIASNPVALRSFKQEVLLARSITHPNVCRIFDLWRDDATEVLFLTMEFLPGGTLTHRIKEQGPIPTDESLPIARQMAEALDAAHRAGIVHRDFKSPNVMVVPDGSGGRAVVTDFGLAVTVEGGEQRSDQATTEGEPATVPDCDAMDTLPETGATDAAETEAGGGRIVGTPAYMAPEQVRGESVGPASDLYALGVVLFEMSTGTLPFRGASALETARAHLEVPPPTPSSRVAIDDLWEETILRLLAKDPTDRYKTAYEAILALEGRSAEDRSVPHSLPAERDAFVGRKEELQKMARLLESDLPTGTRLLTLQGTGGTGKTRLAQKYGWDSLLRWPGGVWFCDVQEARSTLGIAAAVATTLELMPGPQDPIEQIAAAIAARGRVLIVLDNFEQVVEHAEITVGRWLDGAPEARFLVTSRQRLQIEAETAHELHPLEPETRGVELFEVRAWGHRPGFMVDPSNQKRIQEIVKKLDGLPLAIEMAASRLRRLSPEQLEAGLADRFRLLESSKPGRHATLEATLDWSWELLAPFEQAAIAQISVFESGFTLEAAEMVLDLSGFDEHPVILDVLQSLVDKSWLRASAVLGAPRFDTYVTVQAYASNKLRQAMGKDDAMEAEVRHGHYFASMGTGEALGRFERHGGVTHDTALQLEIDNFVSACQRALARQDEVTSVGTCSGAIAVFQSKGPFASAMQLGREVLDAATDPQHRASLTSSLARIAFHSGELDDSRGLFEDAAGLFRELGDSRFEIQVLGNLATVLRIQGRMDDSLRLYERVLSAHRENGDKTGQAIVLCNLGNFYGERSRLDEARENYESALALSRETNDRALEGMALNNLALLLQRFGQVDQSRQYNEAALEVHRLAGNRSKEAIAMANLAIHHMDHGQLETAQELFQAAVVVHQEVGDKMNEGICLSNYGLLYVALGRIDKARALYEEALAIHRVVPNRRFEGITLGYLGGLFLGEDDFERAEEHFDLALAIHREVEERGYEGLILCSFGTLRSRQGRMEEARCSLEEGLTILRDLGDPFMTAKALCDISAFEILSENRDAAREHLTEAEDLVADLSLGSESELAQVMRRVRQEV